MNKLFKVLSTGTLAALMLSPYADAASVSSYSEKSTLKINQLARYDSQTSFGESGTEIVAYDKKYKRAYSINGALNALDILDAAKLTKGKLPLIKRVSLKDFTFVVRISQVSLFIRSTNTSQSAFRQRIRPITAMWSSCP